MRAFVDTNVLARHFTADPPAQARRATRFLAGAEELVLPDLILAELVYVLESVYRAARPAIAAAARATVAFPSIAVSDADLLLRAIEIYETSGIDFAEAYLVASAEATGLCVIASFDRTLDRIPTVNRVEP